MTVCGPDGKTKSSNRPGGRKRWRRIIQRSLAILILVPSTCWLVFTIAAIFLPYPRSFETIAASSTILEDRAGEPIAMFAAPDGQWRIPLDENQISPHLLQAIVAVEDSRFREHAGVDWKSIIGAAFDDLHHLHIRR